jgi:G2/mitotic-specific cyclin-B, other
MNQENVPLTIGTPALFEGFKSKGQSQFKPLPLLQKPVRGLLRGARMELESANDQENVHPNQRRQPFMSLKNQPGLQRAQPKLKLLKQANKTQKLNHESLKKRLKNFIQVQEGQSLSRKLKITTTKPAPDRVRHFDSERVTNPQEVAIYAREIFEYLRETEGRHAPKLGYFEQVQTDINAKMRAVLLDWLVDVHFKFKLYPETLFLTVNLIDRYLETAPINRKKLQLVGVTAMFIAAKYEEIYAPDVKDFAYVTDSAYTKAEILAMEGNILMTLDFHITVSSPLRFLTRYARLAELTNREFIMARYLLELALIDYQMLKFGPSELACAAIYLVQKLFKKETWSAQLQRMLGYSEKAVRPCARELCFLM